MLSHKVIQLAETGVLLAKNRSIAARVGLGIQATVFLMLTMCRVTTATTLVPLSFNDVVAKAEQVVVGEVTDINSLITPDGRKIYTFVTLRSVETIAGNTAENRILTLRLSGGHVGDNYSIYVGMPEFEVGERVMLFVHLNGTAMCPIVGWMQGYFRIVGEGPSEAIKDYSHNPIVGVDSIGNLHRADAPGFARTSSLDSPGISADGGDPGKLVVNPYNSQPALSLRDFIAKVKSIRVLTGFQPEVLAKMPNRWIPVPLDPNGGPQQLWDLDTNAVLQQVWGLDPNNVLQQLWDIDPNDVLQRLWGLDPNAVLQQVWGLDPNNVLQQLWDLDPNDVLQRLWGLDQNGVLQQLLEEDTLHRTPDHEEARIPQPLPINDSSPVEAEEGEN